MLKILITTTLIGFSISSQALTPHDLYCSSNEVSASIFLHSSKKQYVFKGSEDGVKVHDIYDNQSDLVADNSKYSIKLIKNKQVLIVLKDMGLKFILDCI